MKKFLRNFKKPLLTFMLMLAVLLPIISSVFINAEDNIYEAYTKPGEYPATDHIKNPIYIRPEGSNEKGIVGYCFNDHRSFPESLNSPRRIKYTKELGTAERFEELADTERFTGEDLYNGLVRVIYDGFPNNKSGIKEKYALTDGQFRQITQFAVWYYTDKYNMPNRDTSGNNYTQNEKDAFNDLVNSTTEIPAGLKLDIYRSKNTDYQNLLSGHFQESEKVEVEFSKVKIGGTELAGAKIEIYKGTQKVEEWTSGATSHKVQLEPGEYRFHEEAAPEGFLAVTDFTFTVKADGTVTLGAIAQGETVVAENGKVTITDNAKPSPQPTTKEVEFSKVKIGGTELAGAKIEIYKGTQKVEEWTSGATSHKVQLEPGEYRFHEEAAPEGFLAVTDFTFTVKADGTVTLGAIAQGETVVAENGKVTVTDNAKPDPQPGPQPGPKPEPNKPNVEKNSKLPKTGITQVSSIVVAIISGISIITVKRRNK